MEKSPGKRLSDTEMSGDGSDDGRSTTASAADDDSSRTDSLLEDVQEGPDSVALDPLMDRLEEMLQGLSDLEDTPSSLLDDALFSDDTEFGAEDLPEDFSELIRSLRLLKFTAIVDPDLARSVRPRDASYDGDFDFEASGVVDEGPLLINGRFLLKHPIGRGSYGIVHCAYDLVTKREVALKMPRPELRGIKSVTERFYLEGTSIGKVVHPGLVPLLDIGVHDGTPYLVTRLVNGLNLEQWLRQANHPIPVRLTAIWGEQLADAVDHLHKRSIIHSDLKPSNILLEHPYDEDPIELPPELLSVRVTDFGNASSTRDVTPEPAMTIQGTVCFMAPEQLEPTFHADERSDVYAICVILYEMLTGRPLFDRSDSERVKESIRNSMPTLPRDIRPDIPYALQAIVMKGLSKKPEDRYQSAGALAKDLNAWGNLRTPEVLSKHSRRRAAIWFRRNRLTASTLIVASAVSSLILGLYLNRTLIHSRFELEHKRSVWWSKYVDEIGVADRYLKNNSPAQVHEILQRIRAWNPDLRRSDDPREFAWYHLDHLRKDRSSTVGGIPAGVYHLSLVADRKSGKLLAGGTDGTLRVIDGSSGRIETEHKLVDGPIQVMAMSADSASLAVSAPELGIRILDMRTMRLVHIVREHTDEVTAMAFTADSQKLVSCGLDGLMNIFDLNTGLSKRFQPGKGSFDEPRHSILGLALLPDGRRAAIGLSNNRILIINLRTAERLRTIFGHLGEVHLLQVSADGKWLITTGADLTIQFWDINGLQPSKQIPVGDKFSYVKAPVGNYTKARKVRAMTVLTVNDGSEAVAVDVGDGQVRLFEIPSGICVGQLTGEYGHALAFAWLPEHRRLAVSTSDPGLSLWNPAIDEQTAYLDSFERGRFDSGPETLYLMNPHRSETFQWEGGQKLQLLPYDSSEFRISETAAAADGTIWGAISTKRAEGESNSGVAFQFVRTEDVRAASDQAIRWRTIDSNEIPQNSNPPTLKAHPTLPCFLIFDSDGRLTVYDLTSPEDPSTRTVLCGAKYATFRPGTQEILVIRNDGADAVFWNFATGRWRHSGIESKPSGTPMVMAEFSSDPNRLVLCRKGGKIEIRDLETTEPEQTLHLPDIGDRQVRHVVWSAHAGQILVAMGFEDIFLLDLETGKILYRWNIDERRILKVDFSADGESLWVLESPVDDKVKPFVRRRLRRYYAPRGGHSEATSSPEVLQK